MAGNNNTTPLSAGDIGTQRFNDYTANQIGANISKHNYDTRIKSDAELQEFRNVIYKMVSGWTREDRLLQLTEYGDISSIGNNPSDRAISAALTESIIIHLDPEDLRKLRAQMIKKKDNIKAGIQVAERNSHAARKKIVQKIKLTTNTFT